MFSSSPPTAALLLPKEWDTATVHCWGPGGPAACAVRLRAAPVSLPTAPQPHAPGQAWGTEVPLNSDFWAKAGLGRVGREILFAHGLGE